MLIKPHNQRQPERYNTVLNRHPVRICFGMISLFGFAYFCKQIRHRMLYIQKQPTCFNVSFNFFSLLTFIVQSIMMSCCFRVIGLHPTRFSTRGSEAPDLLRSWMFGSCYEVLQVVTSSIRLYGVIGVH